MIYYVCVCVCVCVSNSFVNRSHAQWFLSKSVPPAAAYACGVVGSRVLGGCNRVIAHNLAVGPFVRCV